MYIPFLPQTNLSGEAGFCFHPGEPMNDDNDSQPNQPTRPTRTALEEEARAQRKEAARKLLRCRLWNASLTGAAIVEIPSELYEDMDEDEYEEDEDGGG